MYIYNQLNRRFNQTKIARIAVLTGESYWVLRGHITQAKGDHLDQVHPDQKVLEVIRWWRLVQESQHYSRDHQARVHSDQMVLDVSPEN
jgi:hypothetical protein